MNRVIIAVAFAALPPLARADDPRVDQLEQRVATLEQRLNDAERAARPLVRQTGPIDSGDLLRVTITDLTAPGVDTNVDVRVDPDGKISLPYVGQVKLAGQEQAAAIATIAKVYNDKGIIQNATVSLERLEVAAERTVAAGPLQANDFLRVSIGDLTAPGSTTVRTVQINDKGTVPLPLVGEVKVAGGAEAAAETAIARAYRDAQVIQDARISVLKIGPTTLPAGK